MRQTQYVFTLIASPKAEDWVSYLDCSEAGQTTSQPSQVWPAGCGGASFKKLRLTWSSALAQILLHIDSLFQRPKNPSEPQLWINHLKRLYQGYRIRSRKPKAQSRHSKRSSKASVQKLSNLHPWNVWLHKMVMSALTVQLTLLQMKAEKKSFST